MHQHVCALMSVSVYVGTTNKENGMITEMIISSSPKPNYHEEIFSNWYVKELCLVDKSGI